MSELDKIRENINSIDEQMAQLFQERMEMSRQVAAFKKDRGLSIRDAERERELIDHDRRFIKDPAVDGYYVQFLRSILDLSCAYQSRLLNGMKVAYSGVEGAYGYIAARRMFPEAQLIAYPDFAAAYRAVEQGEAVVYSTLPLGIIVAEKCIITVCLKESSIIRDFQDGLVKNAETQKKTSFILYLLLWVAKRFLQYLKQIDKIYNYMERQLYKSQRNKELIQLLDLENPYACPHGRPTIISMSKYELEKKFKRIV